MLSVDINYINLIYIIINYYNINKKLPEINDNNNLVKSLGVFLYNQIQKYIYNVLESEEYILLCKIPTFEEILISHNFYKLLKMLESYYEKHKILPQKFNDFDEEIILVKFLEEQCENNKLKILSKYQYDLLCKIPTVRYRLNYNDRVFISMLSFEDKIKYIISYYNSKKKLPKSYDKTDIEKSLSYFLYYNKQKFKFKGKNTNEYKLLCTIPTFEYMTNDEKFEKKVKEIILFYNKYKFLPYQSNESLNDKKLGSFLSKQKYYYKSGRLSKKRYDILCKFKIIENYLIE